MSLSDCMKCWNTPCTCGHEYRGYSKEYMVELLSGIVVGRNPEEADEIMLMALKRVRWMLEDGEKNLSVKEPLQQTPKRVKWMLEDGEKNLSVKEPLQQSLSISDRERIAYEYKIQLLSGDQLVAAFRAGSPHGGNCGGGVRFIEGVIFYGTVLYRGIVEARKGNGDFSLSDVALYFPKISYTLRGASISMFLSTYDKVSPQEEESSGVLHVSTMELACRSLTR